MTGNDLDETLFTLYQHDFIMNKVAVLKGIVDNHTSVLAIIQENSGLEFTDEDALISGLKAEIHFSKYHALETMFAITFALLKQPNDVWLWLSTYSFSTFNKMVADVSRSGISSVSGKNNFDTIQSIFFKNCPTDFLEQERTKKAIYKICNIMVLCAKELTYKSEYNSYKHGLRIIAGSLRVKAAANDDEPEGKILSEVPGFVYLDTRDKDNALLVSKSYSYEKSYNIVRLCWHLTSLMIEQRKIESNRNVCAGIETIDFSEIMLGNYFENL
ncbi:MAG: hypothetical protein MIO92_00225 [Methanosarcinaceae archaeon]|nr:hypothetical protein [Methanosarcinaceae archaeon]